MEYPQKIICLDNDCVSNQYPFCSRKEITLKPVEHEVTRMDSIYYTICENRRKRK